MEVNGYKIGPKANLCGANLRGADLTMANLRGANLTRADLTMANLCGANLRGADLTMAKLPHFQICPEEGSFIAWKRLVYGVVCKLLIPETAQRTSSLVGRKCRASFAYVLEGNGYSIHNQETKYTEGKFVYPDSYDPDIRIECTHGIHFFMTRKEAEEH